MRKTAFILAVVLLRVRVSAVLQRKQQRPQWYVSAPVTCMAKRKIYSPHDLQMSSETKSGNGEFCPTIMLRDILLFMLIRVVFGGMSCFAINPLIACPLSLVK